MVELRAHLNLGLRGETEQCSCSCHSKNKHTPIGAPLALQPSSPGTH